MSARSAAVAESRGVALPAFAFALVVFAGYASGRSPWHSGGGVGGVSGTVVAALAGVTGAVVVGTLLAVWVVTPVRRRSRGAVGGSRRLIWTICPPRLGALPSLRCW